jgi:L-fucose isomerase-like protein
MAKFALVVDDWMQSLGITATAIQCWSSLQKNYGVNVCTIMSMMSEQMLPSACEVDIAGVVGMYALQLAGGSPSALVDWNNNYGGDPDKCVFFHCGNWAKDFPPDIRIATAPILGTTLGEENTFGALEGRTQRRSRDLRPRQHRRSQREDHRLRRRRRIHQRPAKDLRHTRGGEGGADCPG